MTPIQFNALVKKAKDTAKKINHTVEKNLFIRIAPTGTATWYAKAKQNNKLLNKCLGNYPAVTVAMADKQRIDGLRPSLLFLTSVQAFQVRSKQKI